MASATVTARACQPSIRRGGLVGSDRLPEFDALCADGRDFSATVTEHVVKSEDAPGQQISRIVGQAPVRIPPTGSTCVSLSPAHRPAGISWPLFAGAATAPFPSTREVGPALA